MDILDLIIKEDSTKKTEETKIPLRIHPPEPTRKPKKEEKSDEPKRVIIIDI